MSERNGCHVCMAPEQPGPGGLPGMVFKTEKRRGHVLRENCSEDQLATAMDCRDAEHSQDCLWVVTHEYEAVTACSCNPFWTHPEDRARETPEETQERRGRTEPVTTAPRKPYGDS